MALTESNMLELGTVAPPFSLPDAVSGEMVSLTSFKAGHPKVIMFLCNHCPFVIHVNPELVRLSNDYIKKGVQFIAISSNDAMAYPQDGPEKMKEVAENLAYPFPYLYDESQQVAKAYDAACTPDFYIFDAQNILVYRGRLDASRPGNGVPLSGIDLRNALDVVLSGQAPSEVQYPSAGCNIKWK